MQERVTQFFEHEYVGEVVEPILVGLSGGPDSLCLLDLLIRSNRNVIAAYFDHQLRAESSSEVEFVKKVAAGYGIPFITEAGNVNAFAGENSLSLEEAARKLRYQFLFTNARHFGTKTIAVAHNADDQVETILMHFIRGSGLSGLKGMLPVTLLPEFDPEIFVIRPLLQVWRSEIMEYCKEMNLKPLFDPTNQDQAYFRNHLRHHLIPELESKNPLFRTALLRSAASLSGDFHLIQELVDQTWSQAMTEKGKGFIAFDLQRLQENSIPLLRNLIRRAAYLLNKNLRDLGFENIDRAANFIKSQYSVSKVIDLTEGIQIFGIGDRLYISNKSSTMPLKAYPQIKNSKQLKFDSVLELGNNWLLHSKLIDRDNLPVNYLSNQDPFMTWVDIEKLSEPLLVRKRIKGDRFQPLGMNEGSIKLSDIFINKKIPRQARSDWPLICHNDKIIWIPGFRSANDVRVAKNTQKILQLSAVRKPSINK